jgi:hypothetical protein
MKYRLPPCLTLISRVVPRLVVTKPANGLAIDRYMLSPLSDIRLHSVRNTPAPFPFLLLPIGCLHMKRKRGRKRCWRRKTARRRSPPCLPPFRASNPMQAAGPALNKMANGTQIRHRRRYSAVGEIASSLRALPLVPSTDSKIKCRGPGEMRIV